MIELLNRIRHDFNLITFSCNAHNSIVINRVIFINFCHSFLHLFQLICLPRNMVRCQLQKSCVKLPSDLVLGKVRISETNLGELNNSLVVDNISHHKLFLGILKAECHVCAILIVSRKSHREIVIILSTL